MLKTKFGDSAAAASTEPSTCAMMLLGFAGLGLHGVSSEFKTSIDCGLINELRAASGRLSCLVRFICPTAPEQASAAQPSTRSRLRSRSQRASRPSCPVKRNLCRKLRASELRSLAPSRNRAPFKWTVFRQSQSRIDTVAPVVCSSSTKPGVARAGPIHSRIFTGTLGS
jgi:hypothetical protein